MSDWTTCYCGTSWSIEFEKLMPDAVKEFHDKEHAKYEQATFERHRQFANAVFGSPDDTKWVKGENK